MVEDPTRNGLVEATIANPQLLLLPGMFGTVEIGSGKPIEQITVPQSAISYNAYGEIAYIIRDANISNRTNGGADMSNDTVISKKSDKPARLIAHQTFVKVGDTRGDQIAVLQGIKDGDLVVTSGQMKLRNGSEVVINNTVQPFNNPSPTPSNEE